MITELKPEEGIAGKFVKTAFDENGVLSKIEFTNDETFNFAFDVVDALAEKTPDKTALIYVSRDKEEKKFTFKEIKEYSNMAANYYKSLGIKKGRQSAACIKAPLSVLVYDPCTSQDRSSSNSCNQYLKSRRLQIQNRSC